MLPILRKHALDLYDGYCAADSWRINVFPNKHSPEQTFTQTDVRQNQCSPKMANHSCTSWEKAQLLLDGPPEAVSPTGASCFPPACWCCIALMLMHLSQVPFMIMKQRSAERQLKITNDSVDRLREKLDAYADTVCACLLLTKSALICKLTCCSGIAFHCFGLSFQGLFESAIFCRVLVAAIRFTCKREGSFLNLVHEGCVDSSGFNLRPIGSRFPVFFWQACKWYAYVRRYAQHRSFDVHFENAHSAHFVCDVCFKHARFVHLCRNAFSVHAANCVSKAQALLYVLFCQRENVMPFGRCAPMMMDVICFTHASYFLPNFQKCVLRKMYSIYIPSDGTHLCKSLHGLQVVICTSHVYASIYSSAQAWYQKTNVPLWSWNAISQRCVHFLACVLFLACQRVS